ncbi:AlkA N-terminal domain-containing protein [Streptomyces thermoviolaceus]|uniref:DNA-3-methyladenine glycosylase 2 family protein n=1 Tax=Streptomyces thermoviolaceus TaxID=1952 RepID=UPI0038648028
MHHGMHTDRERCLRAVGSKDARFDGWFFTAVLITGTYCRPSCPTVPPQPQHLLFHPSAAACRQAGFRACTRCRPDTTPGSPQWNHRDDLVARAVRLIADGVVDREGVPGLAARLGRTPHQIERRLSAELGAGPLALARARRTRTARLLIETTTLPLADIAVAAGFTSVRALTDTVRDVSALPPTALRTSRTPSPRHPATSPTPPQTLTLRLPFRAPLTPDNLFGHLAATAVPGVEEWRDGAYRRTLRLPHGHGIVALTPHPDHIACRLTLGDLRDLPVALARCRRLLDLDADPVAVDDRLRADPVLAPLVDEAPGRRVPRTVDETEFALRAVLGQQVSTAAARTHTARLVTAHGDRIDDPEGGLTHLFPTVEALAALDPASLAMPRTRRTTFTTLVRHLADGTLRLGVDSDWQDTRARLLKLPGLGTWTADVIALRALGDPDAFPATDLGVRRAARTCGLPTTPAALTARAEAWRPWRAYAVQYLWATSSHPVNHLPAQPRS